MAEPKYVELQATLTLTPDAFCDMDGNKSKSQRKAEDLKSHLTLEQMVSVLNCVRDTKFDNIEEM